MHVPQQSLSAPLHIVVLGDSIAAGMCATQPSASWASIAADDLSRTYRRTVQLTNRGVPSNAVSPRCPAYDESAKPSLFERYYEDCIALDPDVVVIAEGLNDMRCGIPIDVYMADMQIIIRTIQQATSATIALVGMYPQLYGSGANDPQHYPAWSQWTYADLDRYHSAIRELAQQNGALFVDTSMLHTIAEQVLAPDACHLNNLGHQMLGGQVARTLEQSMLNLKD